MHGKHLLVDLGEHVADVVPGVAVQALLQPLLVKEVTDEAHAARKCNTVIYSCLCGSLLALV